MKKTILRIFASIICLALLPAGCANENGASGVPVQAGSAAQSGANAAAQTGKYVQVDATPPQLAAANIHSIRKMADGRILAIGYEEGRPPIACASADGTVWEELFRMSEAAFLDDYPEHMRTYAVDDAGVWWVALYAPAADGVPNVDGGSHLYRVENGQVAEVAVTAFGGGNSPSVTGLHVGGDGTLLMEIVVGQQMEWLRFDAAGAQLNSIQSSGFYSSFTAYRGGKIYALSLSGRRLHVFDAATGREENGQQMDALQEDLMFCGDISADEALNFVNVEGIWKMAVGGSYLQNVVAGRAYAFADSSFRRMQLAAAEDGSFWLLGRGGAGLASKLYRYAFDENAPLASAEGLYIWTMEDNTFLKLAVSIYAQAHPNCEVLVEVGRSAEGGQTTEDIIRALNAQMLAGDMPDVLILDELPVRSMIRQGMLTDLSGIINEGEYYENVLKSYTVGGVPYAYPALFRPVGMLQAPGRSNIDIAEIKTFTQLEELISRPDEVYFGGYRHVFDTLYAAASHRVFPGGESLDEAALREFLAVSKAAVDGQGLGRQEFCPIYGEGGAIVTGSSFGPMPMEPSLTYYEGGREGRSSAAVSILYGYVDALIYGYNRSGPQPVIVPVPGNAFVPMCAAGVPAGAANEEGGRQFVKTLLECQTEENTGALYTPGFLVRAGVEKQHLVMRYQESLLETDMPPFPNVEELDIEGLIGKLENPALTDSVLRDKLYAQAKLLYGGLSDLDGAVAAVKRDTEIYFAERQ